MANQSTNYDIAGVWLSTYTEDGSDDAQAQSMPPVTTNMVVTREGMPGAFIGATTPDDRGDYTVMKLYQDGQEFTGSWFEINRFTGVVGIMGRVGLSIEQDGMLVGQQSGETIGAQAVSERCGALVLERETQQN